MMYFATTNHLRLGDPEFGVFRELSFNEEGMERLQEERSLVFGQQGMFSFGR